MKNKNILLYKGKKKGKEEEYNCISLQKIKFLTNKNSKK